MFFQGPGYVGFRCICLEATRLGKRVFGCEQAVLGFTAQPNLRDP